MARNTRSFEYDDEALRKLFAEMDSAHRTKALRGAFRTQANLFRKDAINNLRAELNSNSDLEKGFRTIVYKKTLGFRVTVGTVNRKTKSGKRITKGFHTNRYGQEKPVLIWAEDGTQPRREKGQRVGHMTRRGFRKRYAHNGAYHGRMRRYAFMVKARTQSAGTITENLQQSLIKYTVKVAKKYGCKV